MLEELETALASTGYEFRHYGWSHAPSGTYGVYSEDSAQSLWAGSKMVNQSMQGTIDLFTRDDTDLPRTKVQTALASIEIAWYLNSIQYEEDTGYIHYEWVFEVV